MLAGGVAEVVSLGAVIPFLAALAAPEKVLSYPVVDSLISALCHISSTFGLQFGTITNHQPQTSTTHSQSLSSVFGPNALLPLLATAFALAALTAGAIRLLLLWASTRLANSAGADLSLEVYRRTLYQPYSVHVSRNSSTIISNITSKVGMVILTLSSCLTFGISSVIIISIVAALFAINPTVALISALGLGFSYALITKFFKKKMIQNSSRVSQEQTQVVKALQEGLGGIRDVLLDGTQPAYCHIYQLADSPVMESIGMVLFAVLALGMTHGPQGTLAALPVLGALALGAQRLLPALQQGYAAWSGMLGAQASTKEVLELLDQPLPPEASQPLPAPLPFKKSIQFDSVKFRYTSETPWVLDKLSFNITKGTRVGFVGKTGSGKSTCLDLLMGLLEPSAGRITVDGIVLDRRKLRSWQRNIAHVPQVIYLADASLAENIAFGVPPENIEMKRVKEAARQAHIADFIESSPQGYQALVGERGIRLSGGQRQRIGIARALYKQATVLVFDEATSALDHETEQAVMEAIEGLSADLTILIIAHRLTTIKNCTQIIEIG
ncbi:MAG: ABC transporter ATP-binding protein [Actinobacteria bacterium]|nr:ABC transporter ATP-binding protein [Actinomycetota bacterium]